MGMARPYSANDRLQNERQPTRNTQLTHESTAIPHEERALENVNRGYDDDDGAGRYNSLE
jgi:hypothetical protein